MTKKHLRAARALVLGRRRSLLIRAADGIAFFEQNQRNRRQARSADADKMNVFPAIKVRDWTHLSTNKMIMNTIRNGKNGPNSSGGKILASRIFCASGV